MENPEIDQQTRFARNGNVIASIGPFGDDAIRVRGLNIVALEAAKIN